MSTSLCGFSKYVLKGQIPVIALQSCLVFSIFSKQYGMIISFSRNAESLGPCALQQASLGLSDKG